jgi:hypothetical protein
MPDKSCGDCLDFDQLHQYCRVRIDDSVPCAYLKVGAKSPACKDFNTDSSIQLPWFTRVEESLARKRL